MQKTFFHDTSVINAAASKLCIPLPSLPRLHFSLVFFSLCAIIIIFKETEGARKGTTWREKKSVCMCGIRRKKKKRCTCAPACDSTSLPKPQTQFTCSALEGNSSFIMIRRARHRLHCLSSILTRGRIRPPFTSHCYCCCFSG
uniref:Uncharacterized protein n=1 Tax=Trypanosoma vivax (strain Y486) TaxID=1055687 RepID=G0TVR5_TRYVY|nr:hypothetical protein TVY486_0502350 [Trypanosoma vivax Y486]